MGKLKGLLLLLISIMVLNGCQTPTDTSTPTHTELEVRNNSGNVDYWFVNSITIGETQTYQYGYDDYQIRHGDNGYFLFNEEDIRSDLKDVSIGILLQSKDEGGNGIWKQFTFNLNFKIGESRVVRVDCESYIDNSERCKMDGLVLIIVE